MYSFKELEAGQTEDKYWNAAQHEMMCTGKMHNYMRMYWGKRLLEWCADPGVAYRTAVHLNNKWSLDGRDPNGYMGVAWCFGNHDAATTFGERTIFGTIRPMTPTGLQRKFNIDAYVGEIENHCRSVRSVALRKQLPQWKSGGQTGLRSFFQRATKSSTLPLETFRTGSDAFGSSHSSRPLTNDVQPKIAGSGGLSAEQRARIEKNRRQAMERRAKRHKSIAQ